MSQETSVWLNTNTLIGNTDKRGNAWHYRAADQGDESNHYPGPIPSEDVKRRLFYWEPIRLPVYVMVPSSSVEQADGIGPDGNPYRLVERKDRVNIARSDDFSDLGMFKAAYTEHNYGEALLDNVSGIVDDDLTGELGISSAGLLRNGAVAWVEISVPETMSTNSGFQYRPNLVAASSCDGSLATVYKRTVTATVCDNTLSASLGERHSETYKIRHSKNSGFKIANAREALGIIFQTSEAFASEVDRLCNIPVTDDQWELVLKEVIPDGNTQRGNTRAQNTRDKVDELWRFDNRVAPWAGTAFGALQAFNTYRHHVARVNSGTVRSERNMLQSIDGTTDKEDTAVLAAMSDLGILV